MHDPLTSIGDEPVEARIVAWVLGEASGFEAAELERLCEERPELLVFRRRMLALHDLLTEAEAAQPDDAWKLPPEKRQALDEIFGVKQITPADPHKERRIRRSGRRALFAIAACFMLTLVVVALIPWKYESKAVIEVKPRLPGFSPLGAEMTDGQAGSQTTPQFFGTEFEKIKSRETLGKVVDKLDLTDRWHVDKETAIKNLSDSVKTENPKGTGLIEVRVKQANQQDAADITREVINSYKDYRSQLEEHDADRALMELNNAVRDQEDKVEDRRKVLASIAKTKQILKTDESNKEDAVKRGLDAADYVDANRDFEKDLALLHQMKIKQMGESISNKMPGESVVVHDLEPPVATKLGIPMPSFASGKPASAATADVPKSAKSESRGATTEQGISNEVVKGRRRQLEALQKDAELAKANDAESDDDLSARSSLVDKRRFAENAKLEPLGAKGMINSAGNAPQVPPAATEPKKPSREFVEIPRKESQSDDGDLVRARVPLKTKLPPEILEGTPKPIVLPPVPADTAPTDTSGLAVAEPLNANSTDRGALKAAGYAGGSAAPQLVESSPKPIAMPNGPAATSPTGSSGSRFAMNLKAGERRADTTEMDFYQENGGKSGDLTKSGSGTLNLTGSNTYAGATTISGGTVTNGSLTTGDRLTVNDDVAAKSDRETATTAGPDTDHRNAAPAVINLPQGKFAKRLPAKHEEEAGRVDEDKKMDGPVATTSPAGGQAQPMPSNKPTLTAAPAEPNSNTLALRHDKEIRREIPIAPDSNGFLGEKPAAESTSEASKDGAAVDHYARQSGNANQPDADPFVPPATPATPPTLSATRAPRPRIVSSPEPEPAAIAAADKKENLGWQRKADAKPASGARSGFGGGIGGGIGGSGTLATDEDGDGTVVTDGLRNGDATLNRNNIDAILNNPNRVSQKESSLAKNKEQPADKPPVLGDIPVLGGLLAEMDKEHPADKPPQVLSLTGTFSEKQLERTLADLNARTDGREQGQQGQQGQTTVNGGTLAITGNGSLDRPKADAQKFGWSDKSDKSDKSDQNLTGQQPLDYEHAQSVDKVRRDLYTAEGNYNLGKYNEAKRDYENVLRTDPYNSAARRGMEKLAKAKSDYYRAAYDQTRAELLSQVDAAWELSVPDDKAKEEGEKSTESKSNIDRQPVVDIKKLPAPRGNIVDRTDLPAGTEALQKAIKEQEDKVEDRRKVLATIVRTKGIIYKGSDAMKDSTREDAIKRGLDAQDYVDAKRDFEKDQEILQQMKLRLAGQVAGKAAPQPADALEKMKKNLEESDAPLPAPEKPKPDFTKLIEEVAAAEEPYSTFSLNISDASFQVAQAALARGERPDPAGIKVEQFYNAVDYGDPSPTAGEPVAVAIEQAAHPFIPGRNLVRVALKTAAAGRNATQPLRLTLLVDQSGSMVRDDRRAAMDKALTGLASLLTPNDMVTVIGFARTPRLLADAWTGTQAAKLADLINQTANEGGTNLEEAIKLGEQLADRHKLANAQNRIVLFTDGAANLGDADPAHLAAKVKALRQKGISFDIAGIAADDLNDELLGELARNGNGRYYVVGKGTGDDGIAHQLAGAFRPAAENVKVQVHFNQERVARYKLIGFEKDRLKTEDFRNDAVAAAEMAAEEAGVAIYQVEPIPGGTGELGDVSVRFRDTATGQMVERTWNIPHDASAPAIDRAKPSMQLAVLAMLAADKLRGGPLAEAIDFKQLAEPRANVRRFYGPTGRAAEMLRMVDQLK